MNCLGKSDKSSMVVPVFVSHIDNPESEKLVYALLDTQSDTTFILKSTCGDLGLSSLGPVVNILAIFSNANILKK